MFPVGSRVQMVCPGPFPGRRRIIRTAHCLPPVEEPWWFYHIVLEGAISRTRFGFALRKLSFFPSQYLTS
jgi:hypothetical protein